MNDHIQHIFYCLILSAAFISFHPSYAQKIDLSLAVGAAVPTEGHPNTVFYAMDKTLGDEKTPIGNTYDHKDTPNPNLEGSATRKKHMDLNLTKIRPMAGEVFPEFEINPENPCQDAPIVFQQVNDTNVVSWQWDFGEGASPATSSNKGPHTVFYRSSGPKSATLTVGNGEEEETFTLDFTVSEPVDAAFNAVRPVTGVLPASVIFQPFSPDLGYEYEWNFGNPADTVDNISNEVVPNYSYPNGGEYLVSLTITNPEGCSNTFYQTVEIDEGDADFEAGFAIVTTSHTCVNNTVTLTDMSRGYEGNERVWYFGEDEGLVLDDTVELELPMRELGPIDVYWTQPGMKRITLVVEGQDEQETKTASILYQVYPYPNANFTFEGETCDAPANITFTPQFASGNLYEWTFGDGSDLVKGSKVNHTYQEAGEYTVTLSVTNKGGCTSVVSRNITIGECEQPPSAAIIAQPARKDCSSQRYTFESGSLGTYTNFEWDFGAGISPSTLSGPGPHEVTIDPDAERPLSVTLTVTDENGNQNTVEAEIP